MTRHLAPVCCLLLAAALLVVPGRRGARHRLRRLATDLPTRRSTGDGAGTGRRRRRPDRARLGAVLGGVALAVMLGGWFGVAAGLVAAVALDRGLRRLPSSAERSRRAAEAAELPFAADLLAVALRAGAPTDRAAGAVAEAVPGPLGERFARVARVLQLGGTPAEAWDELSGVPGGQRLAAVAVRSAEHGSALASALGRLADDLRAERAVALEAAARRAGVLIVLPLALCFLPAFILAGLVPVIVAVLGDVWSIERGVA